MPRLSETALGYAFGDYSSTGNTGQITKNLANVTSVQTEANQNAAAIANVFNPTVGGASVGDVIAYLQKDGENVPTWQYTDLKLGGLSNLKVSGSAQHQTIKYNAGNWENVKVVEGFTKAEALEANFLADADREGQVIYLSDGEATNKLAYVSGGKLYGITAVEITAGTLSAKSKK